MSLGTVVGSKVSLFSLHLIVYVFVHSRLLMEKRVRA